MKRIEIANVSCRPGFPLPARLPFSLPDFTRVQWVSPSAEATWAPRLRRIASAWMAVELESVARAARASALQSVMPDELPKLVAWAASQRCVVLPLAREGVTDSYSSTPSAPGARWSYRVAVTSLDADAVRLWPKAWAETDHAMIGRLLGFPSCCQEAFTEAWRGQRLIDTTWTQAARTVREARETIYLDASMPAATNLLLRWLGVRLVPHLPCAHDCEHTQGIADNLRLVADGAGYAQEWAWIDEMLSWPVEWSALHGIALIVTPFCTVSAMTDATSVKLCVRREGAGVPADAPTGTRFPYRSGRVIPLTTLKKFASAFEPPSPPAVAPYMLNGFSTQAAQDAAHDLIAGTLSESVTSVLDLGCGDGTLARRLAGPDGVACGVEADPVRAEAARARLDEVATGSLFGEWPARPFELVVLMPGRLLESPLEAELLRPRLTRRRLLVYAYGDSLARYGSLKKAVVAAGLPWSPIRSRRSEAGEAALLEV